MNSAVNQFFCFVIKEKNCAPNVGLEPTTLRLRVSCSTDWASRAVGESSNRRFPHLHSHPTSQEFETKRAAPFTHREYTDIVAGAGEFSTSLRYGLVVRIPGSHPGGPGSIPGVGIILTTELYSTYKMKLLISLFTKRLGWCDSGWEDVGKGSSCNDSLSYHQWQHLGSRCFSPIFYLSTPPTSSAVAAWSGSVKSTLFIMLISSEASTLSKEDSVGQDWWQGKDKNLL